MFSFVVIMPSIKVCHRQTFLCGISTRREICSPPVISPSPHLQKFGTSFAELYHIKIKQLETPRWLDRGVIVCMKLFYFFDSPYISGCMRKCVVIVCLRANYANALRGSMVYSSSNRAFRISISTCMSKK